MKTFSARFTLTAAVFLAAACTPSSDSDVEDPSARIPSQADVERVLQEGLEPSLRRMAVFDYWSHYTLMQTTGIDTALGGEAQAIAALQAMGNAYEKQLRGPQGRIPRLVPASFTGEGMDSGLMGVALAMTPAMIASLGAMGSLSDMSATDLEQAIAAGPVPLTGKDAPPGEGTATRQFTANDVTTIIETGVEIEGLTGKTRSKVRIDMCPDAAGTITVDVSVDSSMQVSGKAGTGGGVSTHMHMVRHLDDDARLMAGNDKDYRRSTDIRIGGREGGDSGRMLDITLDMGKGDRINDTRGIGVFESEQAAQVVDYARKVETTMATLVEGMLTGAGGVLANPPWESGHCVTLKPTSTPAKRKGAKPSTHYQVDAAPRAKSDGAPTGGTVTATLSGGSTLQPASGKVPADAKYAYTGPAKKDEKAAITFEARSKRGVGRATLEFDTRNSQAYTAVGGLDDFQGAGTICDLAKPFTISGGGNTVTFTPTSDEGGSYRYQGNMGGIGVYGDGTYSVSADENGGTLTGTGNGCVRTPMGTRCNGGTERYTLTPIPPCES